MDERLSNRMIWLALQRTRYKIYEENIDRISEKYTKHYNKISTLFPPVLEDISIPHWNVFPILGKSPEDEFWYRLSRGVFNVNMRLRTMENLEYLEERDLFHDVIGHLPILHDRYYSNYLRALGNVAMYIKSDKGKQALSNVYWFTSEFGLIKSNYEPEVYGAGILSSPAELQYALSNDSPKKPFDIEEVANIESYVTDGFQEQYYVLENWFQLTDIIKYLWENYV